MKIRKFFRKGLFVFAGVVCFSVGYSQTLYPPTAASPIASGLGAFGETSVNLFTGTPNISIPLHVMSYGKINVPVSLRYQPSLVKPGQQPGWVGSGWDLESIGAITRQVRGGVDENYIDDSHSGNYRSYYPYPPSSSQAGANFGSYFANVSNWNASATLAYDDFPSDNLGIDAEADEFTFNVLGHTGKFYYEGSSGWQVVSDESIKVEMTDMYSPIDIANAINASGFDPNYSTPGIPTASQSRAFGGFTLTMADGTKFYFGGRLGTGAPDAVEFYSQVNPINLSNPGSTPPTTFVASSWLLKSIVDINGNTITFNYIRKKPTCNKSYGVSYHSIYSSGGTGCSDNGGAIFNKNQLSGVFQWPEYLVSINSPNEIMNFSCSDAVCNRYPIPELSYADLTQQQTISLDISILGIDNWPNGTNPGCLTNLQWEKLDKIIVTDNMHNSSGINNYNPNIIKQFQFNYSNTSTQRLILGSLQALDKSGNLVNQYQFSYNSDFTTKTASMFNPALPIYADGDFTDHWGFYNGVPLPTTPTSDFTTFKQPSPAVVTTELLNQITYPTGGHTSFTWESNDYSQVVAPNRQQPLLSTSGFGGGSRIFEIKNVLADGTVATDKKYYYKNGYTAGSVITSLSSSGVLNGTPQYLIQFVGRYGIKGVLTFGGTITSMVGIGNYGYTGQGSPVGYKEVDEVEADGSYAKNIFTNFDADLNNVSHFDIAPSGYLGWQTGDTYFPFSSLELERGKLIGQFQYTPSNILLQKDIYTYRSDAARFTTNNVHLIDNRGYYRSESGIWSFFGSGQAGAPPPGAFACTADAIAFTTARYVYNYSYYPVLKTVTKWDQQGANPLVASTAFTYNPNNLLRSKTETGSMGETIVSNYSYPTDNGDATSIAMTNAHILSPVMQTTVTRNGVQTNLLRTNYYQPYTGIYVPQTTQEQVAGNTIETRTQVNRYDAKGHPLEIQKPNGVKEVYLWGCNSQYILAKIIGSDYVTASALVSQSILDQAGVGYNNYTDADIRTELNKLRTGLPGALVTTYTYACDIGMSSETDPNNKTVYYEYDLVGRLIDIRDQDNNVIKKFDYQYQSYAYATAVWQSTGTLQCKPCPANSSFITNMQQHQEKDVNPQSATYNAVRWIDDNIPGSCVVSPSWQTVSVSCQQSAGQNTGFQLTLQQDQNPCSATYNQQQTITSYNATACPVPPPACGFSMNSGYSSPTNSLTGSAGTVNFYIVFYATSSTMVVGGNYYIAVLTGSCNPSATRTVNISSSGRTWQVTITGGMFLTKLVSGPSVTPGTTVNLTGSYSL